MVEYGRGADAGSAVEIVSGIYDAFARRDLDALLALAAPYRGHDGLREYFAHVEATWDALDIVADDIRATAGGVVVFGHVDGRIGEERVSRRVVWTWQVRDGRARSVRVNDLADLA